MEGKENIKSEDSFVPFHLVSPKVFLVTLFQANYYCFCVEFYVRQNHFHGFYIKAVVHISWKNGNQNAMENKEENDVTNKLNVHIK